MAFVVGTSSTEPENHSLTPDDALTPPAPPPAAPPLPRRQPRPCRGRRSTVPSPLVLCRWPSWTSPLVSWGPCHRRQPCPEEEQAAPPPHAARRPPPRRTLRHRCSRVLQSICARFNTGRTGTSGAAAAAVLSSQPMDTSMLSNMANVPMMVSATKYETKEGIYGEYQVEVKEQAVDDARR